MLLDAIIKTPRMPYKILFTVPIHHGGITQSLGFLGRFLHKLKFIKCIAVPLVFLSI